MAFLVTHNHQNCFSYRYDFFKTCIKSVNEISNETLILNSLAHRISKADSKDFEKFVNGNKKIDHKAQMKKMQK